MNADCIFCKIVAGQLPSTNVYEDDDVLAFMDIGPVTRGHTLVIPKRHFDPITSAPEDALHAVISVVKRIAAAQYEGLGADGINVTQANGASAGQIVPHVHFHVIPRVPGDEHGWNTPQGTYSGPDEMQDYADRIVASLHNSSL